MGHAFVQTSGYHLHSSLLDSTLGYLSLFDADHDRNPRNKYLAEAVNYSVHFQWVRCLFWDTGEWKSGSFSPQPGTSPEKVSCRYGHAIGGKVEIFSEQLPFPMWPFSPVKMERSVPPAPLAPQV